ncbi:MAG: PKD domain-containing protein [Solirubrobacteraceae bacterium]
MSSAASIAAVALVALLLAAAPAGAVVLPAVTVDGPSQEIVGFGGVAMAEDGTGGVVYLKRSGGVPHVFVSRFVGGQWQAPIRVDTEEPFAASWPRIGAADGGELIVTWATQYATREGKPLYELLGSELGPGAEGFGRAIFIDSNIEEATGTNPDLAVSSTGQADIVYRIVEPLATNVALLRPGDVVEQVRVAHFDGERWSNLGAINRNPSSSMRPPTQANAPAIAIGPTGNAVVVWQEPDTEGVARIWARRLFGSALDYVMPVSATTFNGAPISTDSEAPSVAFSRLGQADVAYRQAGGPGSPLPGPRIFINVLPDGESTSGAEFEGAQLADQSVGGGAAAVVGPPSIDIDEDRNMRLLYDSNGTPRVIEASGNGLVGAVSLGPPFAGSEPFAASVMDPQGGGVSAWPSEEAPGHPAVAVRENFPSGAVQTALVSGGAGGEVDELSVGRSGLGDGIIAFRQGEFGNAAIVAAQATAPPVPFVVSAPKVWVKPSQAKISWLPAQSAAGPITYGLVLDGHVEPTSQGGSLQASVDPRGLSSGRHRLQVLATDRDGQSTLSAPVPLLIAGVPPTVRIQAGRGSSSVSVLVSDPYDGVKASAVSVGFGDGTAARGRTRLEHRYARPGVYLVTVHVRDRIGNSGTVRRWVSVR